jgi:hypothetical protein
VAGHVTADWTGDRFCRALDEAWDRPRDPDAIDDHPRARDVVVCAPSAPDTPSLVVKRYRHCGALPIVASWFGCHHAQRAWRVGRLLCSAGLSTPQPVALLRLAGRAGRREWWYVTECVPDSASLADVFRARVTGVPVALRDVAWRAHKRALLEALAVFLARLHRHRIYHGDFTAHNVLVDTRRGTLFLVDLEAVRTGWLGFRGRQVKNLDEIGRNCLDLGEVSTWDRARFLRRYLKALGDTPGTPVARLRLMRRYHRLIRAVHARTCERLRTYGQRFTSPALG